MKMLRTGLTAATLAMVGAVTFAQQTKQSENPRDSQQDQAKQSDRKAAHHDKTGSQSSQQALTKYFAGKLMLMNHGTIKMSEMAQQRSSSEEVKQFAEKLADRHAQLNQKLNEWAPDMVAIVSLGGSDHHHPAEDRADAKPKNATPDRQAQQQGRRNTARNAAKQNRGAAAVNRQPAQEKHRKDSARAQRMDQEMPLRQVLEIEREATENYLQSSTQMLGRYEGQDFDMGFLGFQIGAHTWALAELKAMDSVGDQDFQQLVRDASTNIKQHLQEAQRLSKRFEDDRDRRGGDRSQQEDDNARR